MPNDFKPTILVSRYHLGVMLTNSVQYALPRSTGMPLLVQTMFKAYLSAVPTQSLEMAHGDISRALLMQATASTTVYEWPRTLELIRDELARRGEVSDAS